MNFKQNLLAQNVQMDSCVNFNMNGDITVIPCPWESDKEVTNGGRVRYRGGIEVDADGRTHVKRYNDGANGPMRQMLFETTHGGVKMTRPNYEKTSHGLRHRLDHEFVYVTFKFPKKYPLWMMKENLEREYNQVMSYLNTRKEETQWK